MNADNSIFPYIHPRGHINYVPIDHQFMKLVKDYARAHSLDDVMPNASVVVIEGRPVSFAANGSDYHKGNECERIKRNIPTGEGYELCEGCHPRNHSEQGAVRSARAKKINVAGADLYLWGHWWCCKPCWEVMFEAGLKQVYLLEDSQNMFNKLSPENIVGHQFE